MGCPLGVQHHRRCKGSARLQGLRLNSGAELRGGICGRTQQLLGNPRTEVQLGFPRDRTKDQKVTSSQPSLRSHCSCCHFQQLASVSLCRAVCPASLTCDPSLWPPNSPLIPDTTSPSGFSIRPRASSWETRAWPSSASDWFSWVSWTHTSGAISCGLRGWRSHNAHRAAETPPFGGREC